MPRGYCPVRNRGGMASYGGRVRSQNGPINRPRRPAKVVIVKADKK